MSTMPPHDHPVIPALAVPNGHAPPIHTTPVPYNPTRVYILSALLYGPTHGYALRERLIAAHPHDSNSTATRPRWTVQAIYNNLYRMLDDGHVYHTVDVHGGKLVTTYHPTLAGLSYLEDSLTELHRLTDYVAQAKAQYIGATK
jgi:DNA-binding PadR family transcriptional regulator